MPNSYPLITLFSLSLNFILEDFCFSNNFKHGKCGLEAKLLEKLLN